jgi:hypothetical protein
MLYDLLRARYQFHCPRRPEGETRLVALSRFRSIERLPGAAHPAVYRISYLCDCGDHHQGLVAHSDLDYGPIVPQGELEFRNLLTGRAEPIVDELADLAQRQVQRGNWPWRLYCSAESALKPVFPSCLTLVSPAASDLVGVAMHCPTCGQLSLNVVTESHLDVPFHHDQVIKILERPFGDVRDLTVERFHAELHSAGFDTERARLD